MGDDEPSWASLPSISEGGKRRSGWGLGMAMLAMACGLVGADLQELGGWQEATSVQFVGKSFITVSVVIGSFFGGYIAKRHH